jgi:hypothetical protein
LHGVTFFPSIEREPQKIVSSQNERLDLRRQYRNAGPTYSVVDEFAIITFLEDRGDIQDVIACAPGNLPPGYDERRNQSEEQAMFIESHLTACLWAGRVLTALVVLALLGVAATMLVSRSAAHAQLAATGFADSAGPLIGITALGCALFYAVPQTAVLGAILVTGFLGGAFCTHFRLGTIGSPPQMISLALGVMAWGGVYLRYAEVRRLLPISM